MKSVNKSEVIVWSMFIIFSISAFWMLIRSTALKEAPESAFVVEVQKTEEAEYINPFADNDKQKFVALVYDTENESEYIVEIVPEDAEAEKPYIELDEETIRDFAALVYLESGSTSRECQAAVASVILNRMTTRNSTFYDIAYAPNQFTPAARIKSTTPSEMSMEVVKDVVQNGPSIDEYVCYFRASYYFDWGDRYCNYINIDNVYFSYDSMLKERLENESV